MNVERRLLPLLPLREKAGMRGMTASAVTSPGYSQDSTRTPALPLRARCPRSQRVVEEADIHVAHLSLVNFRSYPALSLDLRPGTVVVYGGNGQGKSNLLESIYMLAIAKSPRASADRELVRRQASDPIVYSRVAAVIREGADDLKLQIDIGSAGTEVPGAERGEGQPSLMKRFRVNGAPRRAADLVGYLNAVMFSAHDLEVVYARQLCAGATSTSSSRRSTGPTWGRSSGTSGSSTSAITS